MKLFKLTKRRNLIVFGDSVTHRINKFSPQERLIGVLSGGQEGGSEMSGSGAPAATKHDTIMRKYSVKNTLYHKTSPVIVT